MCSRALKHKALVNVGVINVVDVILQNSLHVVIRKAGSAFANVVKGLDKAVPFSNVATSVDVFSIEEIDGLAEVLSNREIGRVNGVVNARVDNRGLIDAAVAHDHFLFVWL